MRRPTTVYSWSRYATGYFSQIPRSPNPRDFKVVRFLLLRSQELLHVIGPQAVKPWLKFNELASGCKSIGKFVKPELAHGLVKVWPSRFANSRSRKSRTFITHIIAFITTAGLRSTCFRTCVGWPNGASPCVRIWANYQSKRVGTNRRP